MLRHVPGLIRGVFGCECFKIRLSIHHLHLFHAQSICINSQASIYAYSITVCFSHIPIFSLSISLYIPLSLSRSLSLSLSFSSFSLSPPPSLSLYLSLSSIYLLQCLFPSILSLFLSPFYFKFINIYLSCYI